MKRGSRIVERLALSPAGFGLARVSQHAGPVWRREPIRDRRAVLETTRPLDPEEIAELQIEQGYLDRALAIYEGLLREEPENRALRRRCEWLRRLSPVRARPVRAVGDPRERTLRGFRAPWT